MTYMLNICIGSVTYMQDEAYRTKALAIQWEQKSILFSIAVKPNARKSRVYKK